MDYTPTKITLTREGTGFSEDASRKLGELSRAFDCDPRKLATALLVAAVNDMWNMLAEIKGRMEAAE